MSNSASSDNPETRKYKHMARLGSRSLTRESKTVQEAVNYIFNMLFDPKRTERHYPYDPHHFKAHVGAVYKESPLDYRTWKLKVEKAAMAYMVEHEQDNRPTLGRDIEFIERFLYLDEHENYQLAKVYSHQVDANEQADTANRPNRDGSKGRG